MPTGLCRKASMFELRTSYVLPSAGSGLALDAQRRAGFGGAVVARDIQMASEAAGVG